MLIGAALRRTATVYPEKIAVVDKLGKYWSVDSKYTYAQVHDKTNRLANGLLALGMQRGDRVALLTNCKMGFYLSMLAVMKAGLILVPVNAAFGMDSREFTHLIKDSNATALIVDADIYRNEVKPVLSEMPALNYSIGLGNGHGCKYDWNALIEKGLSMEPFVDTRDDDLVLIQYTSGTTGLPKGAMFNHKNLSSSYYIWCAELRLLPHYNFLVCIPSATSGGIGLQLLCVFRGMTLFLSDFNTTKILKIIEEEKIDCTLFAPTMTSRLVRDVDAREYDYSSLKSIVTAAAPISAELLKEASKIFGDKFVKLYGPTEACLLGTFLQPEERAISGPLSKRLTSVGKACLGYEIKVIDEKGKDVKPGHSGEVLIKGDPVAIGYWNLPDSTDFKDGWWHSGDLALVDEDCYIHIIDRKKDMILSGGMNIYPQEIEAVISTHPGVLLVSVIGVPDEDWGESVKAVVVLKEGASASEQEIIEFCKHRLASYKKPSSVDFLELSEIPLMAGGYKVLKRKLKERYRDKNILPKGTKVKQWGEV